MAGDPLSTVATEPATTDTEPAIDSPDVHLSEPEMRAGSDVKTSGDIGALGDEEICAPTKDEEEEKSVCCSWCSCFDPCFIWAKGCMEYVNKLMTPGRRIALSMVFSSLDWISDWAVIIQWFVEDHFAWACAMLFFILLAGVLQAAVLSRNYGVKGPRLILYILGIGVYSEAFTFYHHHRKRASESSDADPEQSGPVHLSPGESAGMQGFVLTRGIETLIETLPCGALQLYIGIVSGQITVLSAFSITTSVLGLGYGIMALFADFPNLPDIHGSASIRTRTRHWYIGGLVASLVVTDFLWRVIPVALFVAAPPDPALMWRIVIYLIIFAVHFGLTLTSICTGGVELDDIVWGVIATTIISVVSLFSVALWVMLLLEHPNPTADERRPTLAIMDIILRSAICIGLLVYINEDDMTIGSKQTWYMTAVVAGAAHAVVAILFVKTQWSSEGDLEVAEDDTYEENVKEAREEDGFYPVCCCW